MIIVVGILGLIPKTWKENGRPEDLRKNQDHPDYSTKSARIFRFSKA